MISEKAGYWFSLVAVTMGAVLIAMKIKNVDFNVKLRNRSENLGESEKIQKSITLRRNSFNAFTIMDASDERKSHQAFPLYKSHSWHQLEVSTNSENSKLFQVAYKLIIKKVLNILLISRSTHHYE